MEPQSLLADGEEILYQTGKHWAVLIKAALYLILALVLFSNREAILRHIPYSSAYEAMREAPHPAAQNSGERILPPQTMEEAKHIATLAITWTVTGACILLALFLAFLGVAGALGFFSNRVIITTKRLIQCDTLLGSLLSLSLANVESVRVVSGLFGAMLGYGKVVVSMSSGQKAVLATLRRPAQFERELFSVK